MSTELSQINIPYSETNNSNHAHIYNRLSPNTLLKRSLDIVGASLGILLLSPVLVPVAIIIKLSSPGPIFYSQNRVGQGGRIFRMYKLRSMYINADELKAQLMAQNEQDGPAFKMKDDPRITPIGKWIRKHSIDELPQLYNVLKGDLSLVGPRPALREEVAKWQENHYRRLLVPQGLTCTWQVSGRNSISFDEWMKLDIQYAENTSFLLDLRLILKTFLVVVKGTGS